MCSAPGTTAAEGHRQLADVVARASGNQAASTLLNSTGTTTKTVRLVYLVPADSVENPDYTYSLGRAIEHLQIWYRNEMGNGKSFNLPDPVVEVYQTPHNAAWYATNPNGDTFLQFWNNVLQDGFALTGGSENDPDNIWIFYIDADPACGQCGGCGVVGRAVISANDLRGLVGQPWVPICEGDNFSFTPCRFVGGLGHEFGHALGLPHPPGCDTGQPTCDAEALMWVGFYSYPNAHLTEADKATLNASPFFEPIELTTELFSCDDLLPPDPLTFNGTVLLEGPYGSGTMSTDLNAAGFLPLIHPYTGAPWSQTANSPLPANFFSSHPDLVDWLYLELRSGDPGLSMTIEASAVGFVNSDGSIVGLDGTSPIAFSGVLPGSYYVVLDHRNHASVMSPGPIDFTSGPGVWDFTTAMTQAYSGGGTPMHGLEGGTFGLFSSDGNLDGEVTALDFNLYNAQTTSGVTGYQTADFNLDGEVTALDFNLYNANTTAGASSQVPDP